MAKQNVDSSDEFERLFRLAIPIMDRIIDKWVDEAIEKTENKDKDGRK